MACGVPGFLCTPSVTNCLGPKLILSSICLLVEKIERTAPNTRRFHSCNDQTTLAIGKNALGPFVSFSPHGAPHRRLLGLQRRRLQQPYHRRSFVAPFSCPLKDRPFCYCTACTTTPGRRPADPASAGDLFHLRRTQRYRADSTTSIGLRPVGLWQPVDSTSSSSTCGSVLKLRHTLLPLLFSLQSPNPSHPVHFPARTCRSASPGSVGADPVV